MGNLSDFDDLVKELDQVEQEAKALQDRIAQFMDNARQAFGDESSSSSDSDVAISSKDASGNLGNAD